MRDELLRELRQELFEDLRSELLRSQQETAEVQQENAALRQRIEELESASVSAPAEYLVSHLFDPVISLTQLGDFTVDEARWALFQSNNDLDTAAEILLS